MPRTSIQSQNVNPAPVESKKRRFSARIAASSTYNDLSLMTSNISNTLSSTDSVMDLDIRATSPLSDFSDSASSMSESDTSTLNSNKSADMTILPRFDYDDADLVLRSFDGFEFRVHKTVLSSASDSLKYLSQDPPHSSKRRRVAFADRQEKEHSSLPIVSVDHSSVELDRLLRYIYPIGRPKITSLADIQCDINLLTRWDLEGVRTDLGKELDNSTFISQDPTAAYALATQYKFLPARDTTLRILYKLPFEGSLQYFQDSQITCGDLQRLIGWKKRYLAELESLMRTFKIPRLSEEYECDDCYLANSKWCWWPIVREWIDEQTGIFDLDKMWEVMAQACQECEADWVESFKGIQTLRTNLMKKIEALPVIFEDGPVPST
ncbi:hypothetical protein SISSUDRAFT_1130641 [Sistotremastrum suecicum HHB10207 ss-3]|uniref:BTB domain-containing protein n=1 Tax=Sistotremastrum suecicum HHB10207 ss-3 TaxID=1314776 RepID=A0A166B8L5_9AGAM|nr:hypothetical protein SISSUDRAFT_1130641 [Sistotremastrum suecicum HHB10207 ss-3]